jgi:hypothetical protein
MRRSKFLAFGAAVIVVVSVSGCDMIAGYFRAQKAAKIWDGPVEEIVYEKLEKDGKVFEIELRSRIDAPVDVVWAAMLEPEKLAENSDQYKKSELISETENSKELDLHVLALDNLQQFKILLVFDEPNKIVKLSTTESTLADIEGSYLLEPSPDGKMTLYTYKAIQTDKVALPISVDVQRSALKESFVNQVRAIKKQIGQG